MTYYMCINCGSNDCMDNLCCAEPKPYKLPMCCSCMKHKPDVDPGHEYCAECFDYAQYGLTPSDVVDPNNLK